MKNKRWKAVAGAERTARCMFVLAGIVSVLLGCQTTPRAFDGIVGYTAELRDGQWYVTYTDDVVHAWEELEANALAACAAASGRSQDSFRLDDIKRSEFVRNVPVPVTYPAGVIVTPTGGHDGVSGTHETPQTFNQTEQVIRRMGFRRICAVCESG